MSVSTRWKPQQAGFKVSKPLHSERDQAFVALEDENGEEDLQKAVWYINRLIQRAGADSAAGKELFNMKENKHGFEPKQEFTMGGIAWTVIQTGADWVKCIASDCVEERAFDEENKNDFAASSLRAYLNGEFCAV